MSSMGVSSTKNAMNWADYKGYIEKASELFKEGKVTYAGQHDLVGGQLFFYDREGNGRRDLTEKQQFWIDRYSEAAVVGTTPTTLPKTLPIEVMNLLFGWR